MRLLVSVISPAEAPEALAGGADIVDVKNPAEGSLGAASPAVLGRIRTRVSPPAELSAALGDAPHLPGTLAFAAFGAVACGADYVKVGVLGSGRVREALALLEAVRRAAHDADPRARVVAVGYADAERVGALPPALLPAIARDAGLYGVMLDTAIKDGTSALDALGDAGVAAFLAAARDAGLLAGLAGALRPEDLPRVRRLGPDVVGVRGSACEGGRFGSVRAERVRALRAALGLSTPPSPASAPPGATLAAAPAGGH
ncbi:MAG TPA: (5-formylfuran-3-yl)methyl phosphate synthase [Longimicrobiales bacterium]